MFTALILTVGFICTALCACFLAITVSEMRKIDRRSDAGAPLGKVIPLRTEAAVSS